ncbi:hypothetical protein C5167_012943 [Papaver somniferum]|uniref:Uncharacterized protein n=1 Tax=Papaver somniferum TaxID=3469 RepID=A0A4Y7IYY9_PAPSO|nr:hypothetical protein C5167_012943 [Papaver somniferum]
MEAPPSPSPSPSSGYKLSYILVAVPVVFSENESSDKAIRFTSAALFLWILLLHERTRTRKLVHPTWCNNRRFSACQPCRVDKKTASLAKKFLQANANPSLAAIIEKRANLIFIALYVFELLDSSTEILTKEVQLVKEKLGIEEIVEDEGPLAMLKKKTKALLTRGDNPGEDMYVVHFPW